MSVKKVMVVLRVSEPDVFGNEVEDAMNSGWEIQGSVFVNADGEYCALMTKHVVVPDSSNPS